VDDDKQMDEKCKCKKLAQISIGLEKHFRCGLQLAKDKAWSHTSYEVSIVNKEVTHRKESINQTNKV
jgi:hypothetical protein